MCTAFFGLSQNEKEKKAQTLPELSTGFRDFLFELAKFVDNSACSNGACKIFTDSVIFEPKTGNTAAHNLSLVLRHFLVKCHHCLKIEEEEKWQNLLVISSKFVASAR